MISRKLRKIVVGVATGAAVAIVLGLSVGYQQASVTRNSVASLAHTHHTGRGGEHHTMEKCVKIGGGYRSK